MSSSKTAGKSQPSSIEEKSGIEINSEAAQAWADMADQLPEKITIDGKEWNSSDLSGRARKLLVIYLADVRLIGQQKEMLALAELGLKALEKEIIQSL